MINVVSMPFNSPQRVSDHFWSRALGQAPRLIIAAAPRTAEFTAEISKAKKASVHLVLLPTRRADLADPDEDAGVVYNCSGQLIPDTTLSFFSA